MINRLANPASEAPERNYQADNIRFFLIFLVVLGHLLETFPGRVSQITYRLIYSFHMPAFLFSSGCIARFSPPRLLKKLLIPYLVFQPVYLLFNSFVISPDSPFVLQFTTPFWLLWYLMALIVYNLLLPVCDSVKRKTLIVLIAVGLIGSIVAGYDGTAGYYLSLSRIIVFAPFFFAGYLFNRAGNGAIDLRRKKKVLLPVAVVLIILLEVYFAVKKVPASAFYGSCSYKSSETGIVTRAAFLVCSSAWILFLFLFVPKKKIPIVSRMGSNTMAVYLLHGFIKLLIQKYSLLHYSGPVNLLLSLLITIAIMTVFNIPIRRFLRKRHKA